MKKKILLSTIAILALTMATSCGNKNLRQIYVDTNSMEPTLMEGSYAIEDTSIHEFTYGDIVTYFYTDEYGRSYTGGRIIGLPGDTVGMHENIAVINGVVCEYRYIRNIDMFEEYEELLPNGVSYHIYNSDMTGVKTYTLDVVPEGHYCIIGDSRDAAIDSRILGAIPKEQITGKIVEII